jgi:4-amino-4-deoxy-L-arabinose transferase-like glycosyltransferase
MFKSRAAWAVFAAMAVVRVWVFVVSDNGIDGHHNAFDRPLFVENWVERGGWDPDPAYPPVHFYLLAALRAVTTNLDLAPRLLSLLCGLLAFWPLVLLTRRWFGANAALWTGLGYAVFPLGVRVSALSLEVAPYLLLLALAFERLAKAWEGKRVNFGAALAGALLLTVACATRFDGWTILPVVALYAIWKDRARGWFVAAVACAFPALWMLHHWLMYHDPFHFLSVSGGISAVHMAKLSLAERLVAWPRIVFFTTGPALVIAALIGAFVIRRRGPGRWLLAAFALSLAVFMWRTAQGSFGANETKYAAALGLMLLPFAGQGLASIVHAVAKSWRAPVTIVLAVVVAVAGLVSIQSENESFAANRDLRQTAQWLAQNRGARPVILGTRDQGYLIIVGKIPRAARLLAETRDENGQINVDQLHSLLDRPGAKLLIYDLLPDGLDFRNLLQPELSGRGRHAFTPTFTSGAYTIYLVE